MACVPAGQISCGVDGIFGANISLLSGASSVPGVGKLTTRTALIGTSMATIDFETLTKPISEEAPCGQDLDLAGDMDYLNFMANAEGLLPKSFFGKDQAGNEERPFDRTSIDFAAQFNAAKPFLEQTRDLRLLGLLAKFSILNRDLDGFIACVRAMSSLLEAHWEDVHPRGEDGDFSLRMVAAEAIDSVPTVVMPLQFLPLIEHKRLGSFSYRNYMIAKGEAPPYGDSEPIDLGSVEKILDDVELTTIVERRTQLAELDAAITQIRHIWMANSTSGPPATLDRLPATVGQILTLLNTTISRRDPTAAIVAATDNGAEPGTVVAVGPVTNPTQAAAALAAIATYFSNREPSSPALLLVRQAHALLGKSFLDVLRTLVPSQVERAAFNIGRELVFDLPIESLAAFAEGGGNSALESTAEAPALDVATRAEALAMLDQVGNYLRVAEPSSPIPYLTDRARDLAQRDFLSLLKALLPEDGLKSPGGA